jgi:hypothetical protein
MSEEKHVCENELLSKNDLDETKNKNIEELYKEIEKYKRDLETERNLKHFLDRENRRLDKEHGKELFYLKEQHLDEIKSIHRDHIEDLKELILKLFKKQNTIDIKNEDDN